MQEQLLGYLLDALEDDEKAALERELQGNESLRRELDDLRLQVAPLDVDVDGFNPPSGLAGRTCRLVAWENRKQVLRRNDEAAVAAVSSSSWTFTDVAVAAGVLVAASLLFFPALVQGKYNAAIAKCQNNLREFGVAALNYADKHNGSLPQLPPSTGASYAGMTPAMLLQQGYLKDPSVLYCSANQHAPNRRSVPVEVRLQRGDETLALMKVYLKVPDYYAYNVGWLEGKRYRNAGLIGNQMNAIAADAPACFQRGLPSLQHGDRGYNVLFEDGRVDFVSARQTVENFYQSDSGRVEVPRRLDDVVVAAPSFLIGSATVH